jgi:hypothetical protein
MLREFISFAATTTATSPIECAKGVNRYRGRKPVQETKPETVNTLQKPPRSSLARRPRQEELLFPEDA